MCWRRLAAWHGRTPNNCVKVYELLFTFRNRYHSMQLVCVLKSPTWWYVWHITQDLQIWEWTWHQDAMPGCGKVWVLGVRGRLWASFWEAFGDPGVTLSVFFRIPDRGGNLDGHLGDQTWILVDFCWISGAPGDPLWSHFDDLLVIWTT